MENIENALSRMVQAALDAKKLQEAFEAVGLSDDKIFQIYGTVADAIYYLIGEKTDAFELSLTCLVLGNDGMDLHDRVKMLMAEYRKNEALREYDEKILAACEEDEKRQPEPVITEPEKMREMYAKNGGYLWRRKHNDAGRD